jgi:hypothetical protein
MAFWNKIELVVLGLVAAFWWWRGHRSASRSDADDPDEHDEGGSPG